MAAPVIPSVESLLTPAIDAIVAARPETLVPFNTGGRWTDLIAMWRAELLVALARLAAEAKASRLRTSTGPELVSLCASEFQTTLPPDPQIAFGGAFFQRPGGGSPPAGVLAKEGDTFVKKADPNASPIAIPAATYRVTKTVYVPPGGGVTSPIYVPFKATNPGSAANTPNFASYSGVSGTIVPARALFDTTFQVVTSFASGGSSGRTDPVLVAAARAYEKGQFGPTDAAVVASILRSQSARHYAVFEANDAVPYDQAYVADESWASSTEWLGTLAQSFADTFQGFGCRVRFGPVTNIGIGVNAAIQLKNTDDLAFTDDIDANVRAAVRSYFDDRPDWYSWLTASLQAAITAADPRILQCTSASVFDTFSGITLGQVPASNFGQSYSATLVHYYLIGNAVNTTYSPPF